MIDADRRKDMINLRGAFRDFAKELLKDKRVCIILPREGEGIKSTNPVTER